MIMTKIYIRKLLIKNTVGIFSKNFLTDTKYQLTIFILFFITGIGKFVLGLITLVLWLALWIVNVGAFVFGKIFYRSKPTVSI